MTRPGILLPLLPLLACFAGDWPSYLGPHGNFSTDAAGPLIRDMTRARLLWESEEQRIGFGKTVIGNFPHVPKAFGDLPPGGVASPVVAGGLLIQAYFIPSGPVWDEWVEQKLGPAEFVKDRWRVAADDAVVAIDAASGKTRWKQVFRGKGLNLMAIKYGGWGVTPVADRGKLFVAGTTGRIYALDLSSGKLLWESTVGPRHEELEGLKAKALAERRLATGNGKDRPRITLLGAMLAADGVVIAPDYDRGLLGVDPETGRTLWRRRGWLTSMYNVPVPVRRRGRTYIAAANAAGELRLLRPRTGEILWTVPLRSQHLTQIVAGERYLLVFEPHPTFRGEPVVNPPPDQAQTEHEAAKDGASRFGLLAAYAFDEREARRAWRMPAEYVHTLHMDGGSARRIITRGGLVYYVNQAGRASRLLVIRERDGKILLSRQVPMQHAFLWGGRLVMANDIQHRGMHERPEIWQMYSADPADFRELGRPWRVNEPGRPEINATGGYEVPLYEPFAEGLVFFRTVAGFRCYDLRQR